MLLEALLGPSWPPLGLQRGPWGPQNGAQNGFHTKKSKTDLNIISLSFGSLRLSGVGGWPCQAKMQAKS